MNEAVMIKEMKSILFARVSYKDQEAGYSLPAQLSLLTDYAKRNNFKVVDTVSITESASTNKNRKVFRQMMDSLTKNQEISELVVEKSDRLTRNLADVVVVNEWLNKDENNKLHLVKENLTISKNSKSTDTFIWAIKSSVAQFYTDNLREEVMKGLNQKAEDGWYPGNRKLGYKTEIVNSRKIWRINPSEAYYVKQAFQIYSNGVSLQETVNRLYKLGFQQNGKPISKDYLRKILRDPMYIGSFSWMGKIYKGGQDSIILNDLYYKVQELLEGKQHARFTKRSFTYSKGLIKCQDCSHSLVAEMQKGFIYYRCHNCRGQKYLKEGIISAEILNHLAKFEIKSVRLINWVREALKAYRNDEALFRDDVIHKIELQLEDTNRRRDKLFDDYADGKLEKGFYDRRMEEYNGQIRDLQSALAKQQGDDELSFKLATSVFELALKAKELYSKKFLPEKKQRFLRVVSSNIISRGDYLDIAYKNGFEVLFSANSDALVSQRLRYSNEFVSNFYGSIRNIQYPKLVYKEIGYLIQQKTSFSTSSLS